MALEHTPDGSLLIYRGKRRRPWATATATGIRIPMSGPAEVPWDEVSGYRFRAANGHIWLTFQPVPSAHWGRRRNPWMRWWAAVDKLFGFGDQGMPIPIDDIDVTPEELLDQLEAISGRSFSEV